MMTEHTYWNSNGRNQKLYDRFWDELVPRAGKCDTVEGELLRAVGWIYRDLYNNGFGNNWSGALAFLTANASLIGLNKSDFTPLRRWRLGEYVLNSSTKKGQWVMLAALLELIADHVIQYINSRGTERTPNSIDMHDLGERTAAGW